MENPSYSELRSGDALLLRDRIEFLDQLEIVRHIFIRESIPVFSHVAIFEIFVALDLAGKEPSSEW